MKRPRLKAKLPTGIAGNAERAERLAAAPAQAKKVEKEQKIEKEESLPAGGAEPGIKPGEQAAGVKNAVWWENYFPEEQEICLIAPTRVLAERAADLIRREKLPVSVYVAALESAVELAEDLLAGGARVLISRGGTRDLLIRKTGATVVNIETEASDYIAAMEKVQGEKGRIALFSFKEEMPNELQAISYLLHIDLCNYSFSDSASCRDAVQKAVREGAVWGIGGAVSAEYAEELSLPYIEIESAESSLLHALNYSLQVCALKKESEARQLALQIRLEEYQNVLDYTHDAILAVDEKGNLSMANQVARSLLGAGGDLKPGSPVETYLPNSRLHATLESGERETDQLMNINGTLVSTNRVPVMVDGRIKGAVATFQSVHDLQKSERSIRIKLHEKGLFAKHRLGDILGVSPAIVQARELTENFADSGFTVMLYGETGTGKEMFAQSIHNASPRRHGPFVAINCTALSKSLLESELFGYADGAFTGAKKGGKAGLFEVAHGGTIFLDEIGELPLEFQAPLLRVLQEKEVRRIGSDSVTPVDIRVIGATHRDLMELVREGKFRQDLYYRLNVLTIQIPPLRDRGEDYILIARDIYRNLQTAAEPEKPAGGPDIPSDEGQNAGFVRLMEALRGYVWPGNVRELTNVVERIYLLQRRGFSEESILAILRQTALNTAQAQAVRPSVKTAPEEGRGGLLPEAGDAVPSGHVPTPEGGLTALFGERQERGGALARYEMEHIRAVIEKNGGNLTRAAKELRISRSTLYRKLGKQGTTEQKSSSTP